MLNPVSLVTDSSEPTLNCLRKVPIVAGEGRSYERLCTTPYIIDKGICTRSNSYNPCHIMQVLDDRPKYFETNCTEDRSNSINYLKPLIGPKSGHQKSIVHLKDYWV